MTKYTLEKKHLILVFIVDPQDGKPTFSLLDPITKLQYTSFSKTNKDSYATTISMNQNTEQNIFKFLSEAARSSLHIPSISDLKQASLKNDIVIKDKRTPGSFSDIKAYIHNQMVIDNIEALRHF